MEVANYIVIKALVDQGSSVDILYWLTLKKLEIFEAEIKLYDDQLIGFSGKGKIPKDTLISTLSSAQVIEIIGSSISDIQWSA